jgi:uncharacterized RDD family membrane protein YckC
VTDEAAARAQAAAALRVHGPTEPEASTSPYPGLVTRAIAFAIDAAVVNGVAIAVGVVVGLGISILSVPEGVVTAMVAVGGVLYIVWSLAYFVGFWSSTGQTPGSRVMRIRVRRADRDETLPARRAAVRLIGATLAAIPLGLGFLPILLDDRRRGFQDWLARSVVVHAPPAAG